MVFPISFKNLHMTRILFFSSLILIPNFLLMRVQPFGEVDPSIGLASAVDLVIILPLLLYFFGFKKRVSWLVLLAFIFWGLLLANWIIPEEADDYLTYFNHSVIVLEAAVIAFELFLLFFVLKRMPLLFRTYKSQKRTHYYFLTSFTSAMEETFSFQHKRLDRFKVTLRILATDLAAIYYSLFSWRKKPVSGPHTFTFHKGGSYFGLFLMLVHAMLIEIIAVHMLVAQFSHTAAWVVTILDVYFLLFILADYQAIRLSPIVLDDRGLHFQKGIRQYGLIPWQHVKELKKNTSQAIPADREGIELALHGLDREDVPFVLELNKPVSIKKMFGFKKAIRRVYVKVDHPAAFEQKVDSYLASSNQ